MASEPTNPALLEYLKGENHVMVAAAVACDVVTSPHIDYALLVEAMEVLILALAQAGVRPNDLADVSSDIMAAHHSSCETGGVDHYSPEGLVDQWDAC